jgi:hypothetical protein
MNTTRIPAIVPQGAGKDPSAFVAELFYAHGITLPKVE